VIEARILVIENDESVRDLLTLCLEREGLQVFSYPYANINLDALKQPRPDLIILDFDQPDGGKGWEILQLLKMEDSTANIPILIITTLTPLSAEVQNYLLTRYISIVRKPIDLNPCVALVQKTLTLATQARTIFSSDLTLPILVVDDTANIRDNIATVLRLEGYLVVESDNGRVALDTVSRADHCLILLDLDMPIMNGYEFLSAYDQQLRPHSPVIVLTGAATIQTHALPYFVVDVTKKPFDLNYILKMAGKYAQSI
jgi:DNA-binding NtrC family response regulator